MKLTVLGCGDAFASGGRYNTSFLLENQERKILVDCGATTLLRLKQLKIDVTEIDTIIISHFHGDHYGGLPFLMLSNHIEYGRKKPLTIIGPKGIQEMAYKLQEALYPGTSHVIDSLRVRYLEYEEKQKLEYSDMKLYARQVTHSLPSNPHGFHLEWSGKVFGFSGDTEWSDSLIDLADGTDVFILDCNNFRQDSPGHLSYQTILARQKDLNTKKLLLTHMGTDVLDQPELEFQRLEDGMIVEF